VQAATIESLCGKRYAVVTDGWSKGTAARSDPLVNINIRPDDEEAVFWRIEHASGCIKDADICCIAAQEVSRRT
jgi:hypothetical protein